MVSGSSLLWVGLLTVLLSCEWGLILLYFSAESDQTSTIGIFLGAVAIFHAATNFICHCLCNIKAQRGCKSVLSAFGVREPEEKGNAEFFWSTAPAAHNRNDYEHTLRPVGETMVPDCVQMTYANSQSGKTSYTTSQGHSDNSTMQLHPGVHDHGRVHDTRMRADQYPTTHQQYMVAADSSRTNFGTCPTRQYPMGPGGNSQSSGSNYNGSIYNPNHSVIQNPSLPRMGYADFRPTNGEFEFHQNNYGPPQPAAQRRPLLHQHNGDVEV